MRKWLKGEKVHHVLQRFPPHSAKKKRCLGDVKIFPASLVGNPARRRPVA